jgi:hypothetical protein
MKLTIIVDNCTFFIFDEQINQTPLMKLKIIMLQNK